MFLLGGVFCGCSVSGVRVILLSLKMICILVFFAYYYWF